MMLCSLLSYLDRQILAILSPSILAETHMSVETYTKIVLAFSVAYMIGNPFWGAVIDRIGLRIGMTMAVGIWTVASASHAVMSGFAGFAAARAVLGFGEGATFPGGLRTAMDSLPPEKQSRGIALAYTAARLVRSLRPPRCATSCGMGMACRVLVDRAYGTYLDPAVAHDGPCAVNTVQSLCASERVRTTLLDRGNLVRAGRIPACSDLVFGSGLPYARP